MDTISKIGRLTSVFDLNPFAFLTNRIRMFLKERRLRRELVQFGRLLQLQGFVAATDGNLSVRLDDERVLITPTGAGKGMMKPADMVLVDLRGRKQRGKRSPSSELAMHMTIYQMRPDVHAVVHAHPCTATAFASSGIALDQPLCSEVVITLGEVPLAPYATTGTDELSQSLRPFILGHSAILMANHGVVSYAKDLRTAYFKMESVEHYARIVLAARQLGRQNVLDQHEVEKLQGISVQYARGSTF